MKKISLLVVLVAFYVLGSSSAFAAGYTAARALDDFSSPKSPTVKEPDSYKAPPEPAPPAPKKIENIYHVEKLKFTPEPQVKPTVNRESKSKPSTDKKVDDWRKDSKKTWSGGSK